MRAPYTKFDYISENWAVSLTTNQSIALWSICYSATANPLANEISVKEAAGGRWRVGYCMPTFQSEAVHTIELLFGRMLGTAQNSQKCTAGEAWGTGAGFEFNHDPYGMILNASMLGNPWTTLCPSPAKRDTFFPQLPPGNVRGLGCLLFDTYVEHADCAASSALVKTTGRSISLREWLFHPHAPYAHGVRFLFNKGTTATTMEAVPEHIRNAHDDVTMGENGRKLDGNRCAPNGDSSSWSF